MMAKPPRRHSRADARENLGREGARVCRLAAGGEWIRTVSSAMPRNRQQRGRLHAAVNDDSSRRRNSSIGLPRPTTARMMPPRRRSTSWRGIEQPSGAIAQSRPQKWRPISASAIRPYANGFGAGERAGLRRSRTAARGRSSCGAQQRSRYPSLKDRAGSGPVRRGSGTSRPLLTSRA
jgi:hypothetical protein